MSFRPDYKNIVAVAENKKPKGYLFMSI